MRGMNVVWGDVVLRGLRWLRLNGCVDVAAVFVSCVCRSRVDFFAVILEV